MLQEPDDEMQAKEFVTGDWNKGGAVCFVLEMMNTDDVAFQSGILLHIYILTYLHTFIRTIIYISVYIYTEIQRGAFALYRK